MLNNEDFIKRLKDLLVRNGLSAAAFSERIGVQRSSVSHILSNRNKPSLDFILKIHENFEDVSLEWLLFGKETQERSSLSVKDPVLTQANQVVDSPSLFDTRPTEQAPTPPAELKTPQRTTSKIDHVIEFYKDGSFTVFYPNS